MNSDPFASVQNNVGQVKKLTELNSFFVNILNLEQMVVEAVRELAMVVGREKEYRVASGAFVFFNLTRQDYS